MSSKPVGPSTDWLKAFEEWESSGLNQRDFCARQGYSFSAFRNARVKHGFKRGRHRNKKSSSVASARASSCQGSSFFAVSLEKEQPPKPKGPAVLAQQTEIELKLPFGVVLTFRGVTGE